MSVTVVSRTEASPQPDILKRVRAFLFAVVCAALLAKVVTLITQRPLDSGGQPGFELATIAALLAWWSIRLRTTRARWFDLVVDFALLALLTGVSPVPENALDVYFYPAVLLRSTYEGRNLAYVRPLTFAGALACGAGIGASAIGAPVEAPELLTSLIPLLMVGAVAAMISQLIISHRTALQQESDLLSLSTAIAGEHTREEIARTVAKTVHALAFQANGDVSEAFVVLCEGDQFNVFGPDGLIATLQPSIPVNTAATTRHFGENVAHSLESSGILVANSQDRYRIVAPFGPGTSHRGAIALSTAKPPSTILRNGLGLAAENTGLAIEGADLKTSLEASEERRAALLTQVVTASEDQRATLAGDLHDGPIQSLTALTFELDFTDDLLESGEIEGGRRALRAMKQQLLSEISHLRQTMTKLLPPTLSERGIEKALRDYTRQQAAANDAVRFTFESEIKVRPPETAERMLYRVAQEALANAIRHARPTQIDVSVTGGDDGILITIADDGRGFDTEHVSDLISRDRFGVASMQHIMEMIGGTLKITSSPSTGTTVRMSAPIAPSESQSISGEIPAVQ